MAAELAKGLKTPEEELFKSHGEFFAPLYFGTPIKVLSAVFIVHVDVSVICLQAEATGADGSVDIF